MRPVTLHIEGFGSFREPVDVDFDGTDFFALVGPTGSGKSTVIDAICFALYGSIPRYDDERLVGRAVTLGRSEAKVSLTFDVRGARYVATRVVRVRDGKAQVAKVSLERMVEGGPNDLLADKVKPMKEAVVGLLGLEFSHFTKCVVLPQGAFAQFLHDDQSKRQDLLVRLLDLAQYERIAHRARELAGEADAAVRAAQQRAGELAFATEAARESAQAKVDALASLRTELEDAVPHDEKLRAELDDAKARAEAARRSCELLSAVCVPDDLLTLDEQLQRARDATVEADGTATVAEQELDRCSDTLAEFGDTAALERALAAHAEHARLAPEREQLMTSRDTCAEAVTRCDAVLAELAARVESQRTLIDELRAAHAHAQLRGELVLGEPCPVCEQAVTTLPPPLPTDAVEVARQELATLTRQEEQARAAREQAGTEHTRAQTSIERIEQRLGALAEHLRDAPPAADIEDVLARAKEAGDALAAATKRAKSAIAAAKQAAKIERDLDARVRRAGADFVAQRDPLVPFGAPTPEPDDVVASWRSLAAWAAERLPDQQGAAERAAADVARLTEERAAALAILRARCHDAGLPVARDATIAALVTVAAEGGRDAVAEVDRIDAAMAEAEKARRDAAKHQRAGEVARTLATLLRADRFERWLVTEALDVLVQHASVTLHRLSGGQYSFACDDGGEFVVIDHRNADERRAARTLSGGETFQASLALALALSEQVSTLSADARSRLDAIFLDEGFGTLDADALETVAGTIEHLGADGRMVGIVTHVPALAERVPVRFRVVKNDRTSTVVREEP